MEKEIPINSFSFRDAQHENIEAIALSYILVSFIILFFFDHEEKNTLTNIENIFDLENWISIMQNRLANIEKDIFGW